MGCLGPHNQNDTAGRGRPSPKPLSTNTTTRSTVLIRCRKQNHRKISTTTASLLLALARFSFLLKKNLLQNCVAGNQGFVSCSWWCHCRYPGTVLYERMIRRVSRRSYAHGRSVSWFSGGGSRQLFVSVLQSPQPQQWGYSGRFCRGHRCTVSLGPGLFNGPHFLVASNPFVLTICLTPTTARYPCLPSHLPYLDG